MHVRVKHTCFLFGSVCGFAKTRFQMRGQHNASHVHSGLARFFPNNFERFGKSLIRI